MLHAMKKLTADVPTVDVSVHTIRARKILKALRRNEIADFLVDLPRCAFQIGFIAFAMAAE
jgi:hypothetical protein